MPDGASFADAIDLDALSGSDGEAPPPVSGDQGQTRWPPSRPRAFGRPLQEGNNQYRDVQRIESDSPPPVIVKSNIRPPVVAPHSAPRPSRSTNNMPQPTMTTQQRLRAAIQPHITAQSSSTTSLLPASSDVPGPQISRFTQPAQQGTPSSAQPAAPSTAARLPSPTAYLNGKELHHEILCRLVVEIDIFATHKANLTHGEKLNRTLVSAGQADSPGQYRLNSARTGLHVGSWSSPAIGTLQAWVTVYKLKFSLRYIIPGAIVSTPGLLSPEKSYAFIDIQYPRQGKFDKDFGHQLPVCPHSELAVELTSSLPLQVQQYHFRGLNSIFNSLQPIDAAAAAAAIPQVATNDPFALPAALRFDSSRWNRQLQAAMTAAGSMTDALGLNAASSRPSFSSYAAHLATMAGAQGLPSSSTTFPFMPPAINMPGAWQPPPRSGSLDEDDYLLEIAAMTQSAMNDGDEPLDADMREILSNMAEGTFHGTDALATLYGDKGVDVAKLNLYSDTESLKQRGLKTPLHDHQLQGLLWMIKAEHRRVSKREGESRGLWKTNLDARGKPYYFNLASRKATRRTPTLPRGGINSDAMGLGKTIQLIATCLADSNRVPKGIKPKSGPIDSKPSSQGQPSTSTLPDKTDAEEVEEDFDSEEDYTSDCEESEEEVPRKIASKKRLASTESSDTEEDSDVETSAKGLRRSISTRSSAVKSEEGDSSETQDDEDDEPVRVGRKRRVDQRGASTESGDSKRRKNNKGVKVPKEVKAEEEVKSKSKQADKKETKKEKEGPEYNETTLVVCPLSVLQNWTGQVDEHCDKKKVNYYTYHGDMAKYMRKKNTFATILGKHTFVFTTYDTVRTEYRTIQKRREAAAKKAAAEEEKLRREAEGGGDSNKSSVERDLDVKPSIQRKSNSRDVSEESDCKPAFSASEDEDVKPKIKGRGKGKGKGKGKAKSKGTNRDWYESDDSMLDFIEEDEEEDDELADEVYPRDTPLFEVNWRRIVLDEAHICRNPRTQLYNAICELKGERRWAVTGTPIVNSTKDLGALAAWCGLQPFASDSKEWARIIEKPLKRSNRTEQAAGLLRKVVTSICLRRHKSMKNPQGEPIVKLPDVKFYKHTIPLTTEDRDYYSKCEAACRDHLARWANEGNLQGHQSAILTFLLRLRQMSCHRRLIGSQLLEEIQNKDWDSLDKTKTYSKTLTKAEKQELQAKLKVHVEMEDCPICMEALLTEGKEPVITPCGHPFCKECLAAIVGRSMVNTATCPMDRLPLPPMEQMIELPTKDSTPTGDEVDAAEEEEGSEKTSAKVREAMKIIRATLKKDPTEKILVFSNFVKFLNIIQEEMKEAQISHARFNGSLNVMRRDAVLKKFCKPITPRQSIDIQNNIIRLEDQLQRERAAEKAKAERAARSSDAPSSDTASHKSSSSSLLNSLRTVDRDVKPVVAVKAKTRGKQKEEDVVGDNPSVLLISMGCGALGLNLTVASTVLLMDPWWQSSLEQQSLDRTHRIGQKRDVKVFQIIAENTVEARMLEIQAQKEGLAETAFSGMRATGSASDKRTKVETSLKDLVRLFGLSNEETQALTARSAAVAAGRS